MDQKNLIIAVVLTVLIMVGFQYFYGTLVEPKAPEQTTAKTTGGEAAKPGTQAPGSATPTAPGAGTGEAAKLPGAPATEAKAGEGEAAIAAAIAAVPRVTIASPRLTGSISLVGARIDDLTLVGYRETVDPTSPKIRLLRPVGAARPYFADFGWVSSEAKVPGPDTRWTADGRTLTPDTPVTLHWDNGSGLEFRLTFALDKNYMFTVTQEVANTGAGAQSVFPFGRIRRNTTPHTTNFYILHEGLLGVFDGVLEEVKYKKLREMLDEDKPTARLVTKQTTGGWLGITDKYWLTALIPDQKTTADTRMLDDKKGEVDNYQADFRDAQVTIAPGASTKTQSRFFAGAKEAELINSYRDDLGITRFDLAIDWGWFEFLTKPIFFLLLHIEHIVGNMGISILLLTVMIKLAFFPLANKSYRAMSKMKQLQPEMMKIRERFGEDKARMNQEVMALYKREKANPASGCLPILPQIPVFFSLYKVLFVTIEMRQAPFFGWIHDLSAQDTLTFVNLFGLIDWTPPHYMIIGIWPLIMGLTMFLQQKLNPPPADPAQAKIFMLLPLVFTVMLARFPAGLVIYWAWNNFLSIVQQYVIMRRMGVPIGGGKTKKPAPAAAGAQITGGGAPDPEPDPGPGTSGSAPAGNPSGGNPAAKRKRARPKRKGGRR